MTVLLDNVNSGAANPHGVTVSRDGKTLLVGHRGIHELSVIDMAGLMSLLGQSTPEGLAEASANLGFLWTSGDTIRRVPCGGLGPKGLAVCPQSGRVYVANYYSDTVTVLDPETFAVVQTIDLAAPLRWIQPAGANFCSTTAQAVSNVGSVVRAVTRMRAQTVSTGISSTMACATPRMPSH